MTKNDIHPTDWAGKNFRDMITRCVIQYELKAALFAIRLECERSINYPSHHPLSLPLQEFFHKMTLLPQRHPARVMWNRGSDGSDERTRCGENDGSPIKF